MFDTFTKRMKRQAQGGKLDVYQYDTLPEHFRIQVVRILIRALGPFVKGDEWAGVVGSPSNHVWRSIHEILIDEVSAYIRIPGTNPFDRFQSFMLTAGTNDTVDGIHVAFSVIDTKIRCIPPYEAETHYGIILSLDDAIADLNCRFREHEIGYEFAGGELIKQSSQYIHAEVVRPALSLLREAGFRGPSDEFIRAHKHYREGNLKEATTEALKSFESTMKAICRARGWKGYDNANAKDLINVMIEKEVIPRYLSAHFNGLRSVLEAGLPTIRNKTSGHGQGTEVVKIPDYLAAYGLHLAATNIVFLIEAHNATKE